MSFEFQNTKTVKQAQNSSYFNPGYPGCDPAISRIIKQETGSATWNHKKAAKSKILAPFSSDSNRY